MAIISLNAAIRDVGVEEHVYVQVLSGTLSGYWRCLVEAVKVEKGISLHSVVATENISSSMFNELQLLMMSRQVNVLLQIIFLSLGSRPLMFTI